MSIDYKKELNPAQLEAVRMMDFSPRNYLINKGGPSFTEISRFLREGDILKKYVDYEAAFS